MDAPKQVPRNEKRRKTDSDGAHGASNGKPRKKRKTLQSEVLPEDLYLARLAKDDNDDMPSGDRAAVTSDDEEDEVEGHTVGENTKATHQESELQHETLSKRDNEVDKANATVFVGNLPTSVITAEPDYKSLKALFSKHGPIKSIRFRSIAFAELLPRKVAFLQGKFHPERDTVNAYIVFSDPDHAKRALAMNGHYFMQKNHIRVDSIVHPAAHDNKRCVFIGSLPFDAEEEILWNHFAQAGEIESVRIVRDRKTNIGKGFAYVQFKSPASVQNALLLHDRKIALGGTKGSRKLRVMRAKNMPSQHKTEMKFRTPATGTHLKPEEKAKLGRVKTMMGSQAAARLKILQKEAALEGERARAPAGERVKKKKKKKTQKEVVRSKARAAAYRKVERNSVA